MLWTLARLRVEGIRSTCTPTPVRNSLFRQNFQMRTMTTIATQEKEEQFNKNKNYYKKRNTYHTRRGILNKNKIKDDHSTETFSLGNDLEVLLPMLSSFLSKNEVVNSKQSHNNNNMKEYDNEYKPLIESSNISEGLLNNSHELNTTSTLVPLPEELEKQLDANTIYELTAIIGSGKERSQIEEILMHWPEIFHRFRTISLPLLLSPETISLSHSTLIQACSEVVETLTIIDNISRITGFRAERVFPAPLTAALWSKMPVLYDKIKHLINDSTSHISNEVRSSSSQLLIEFKKLRRALALRIRDLEDLISPTILVKVLVAMEKSGALSDDIIGPIGTNLLKRYKTSAAPLDGPQHVATNHLLSTRFIASVVEEDLLPFKEETAIDFARLLGRVQVLNHFQLHRLLHTIILPAIVPYLQVNIVNEKILLELTACYARYAVSGTPIVQLTTLWLPYIPKMTLDKCTELLQVISSNKHNKKKTRRTITSFSIDYTVNGSEEDYLQLIGAVLERATTLCNIKNKFNIEKEATTNTILNPIDVTQISNSTCTITTINTDSLVNFLCSLVRVNSINWVETYISISTLIEENIDRLKIKDLVRIANAIINRNSYLPFHPLHHILAHRLINNEEALNDVRIGNVALLAIALMSPPKTPLQLISQENQSSNNNNNNNNNNIQISNFNIPSDAVINIEEESNYILAVFRRHGTKLGLRSFVAGLCVAPLAQLPLRSQERIIIHFTSIVSAIEVSWLARGIGALISQIPSAIDPVSVQRWFSRFTAVDVVRQLDMENTALLLNVLSNDNYSRDCALAKRTIVTQAGKLLLQEDIQFEMIVPLIFALQRSNVFFPYLYSRICRLLLSNVRNTSWEILLPVFHSVADEFTKREHRNGSVFRDVWEQVRVRIMEDAGASLSAKDIVFALNGFAALDGRDRPIFSVLLHRLWIIYKGIVSNENTDNLSTNINSSTKPSVWVDWVLSLCTPSALAILVSTLVYIGDGEVVNTFFPWVLLRTHSIIKDLYPIDVLHLMLALLSCFTEVATQGKENEINPNKYYWKYNQMNHNILHSTYDLCRELFLQMYEDESTSKNIKELQILRAEWSPKVRVSVSRVPFYLFAEILIALCQSEMQDEAVAIAAAVRLTQRSCSQLPISDLVNLIMALCFHFAPTLAINSSNNTIEESSRENNTVRIPSVQENIETFMNPNDSNIDNSTSTTTANNNNNNNNNNLSLSVITLHQRFLPPALNALWDRVEELNTNDIDALIRCLKYYYGDKVDKDFLDRLQKHKIILHEIKVKSQQQIESTKNDKNKYCNLDETSKVVSGQQDMETTIQLTAEDLFE